MNRTMLKWSGLALAIVVLDQVSKLMVTRTLALGDQVPVFSFFSWVRWHNEGAAFSMLHSAGGWQRWFFVVLAIVFAGFILYELRRLPVQDRVMGWVYGLILGGAIGNLIDRLHQGFVVDFLLFHWGNAYFPAFNVADMALSVGAAIWLVVMIIQYRQERAHGQTDRQ